MTACCVCCLYNVYHITVQCLKPNLRRLVSVHSSNQNIFKILVLFWKMVLNFTHLNFAQSFVFLFKLKIAKFNTRENKPVRIR